MSIGEKLDLVYEIWQQIATKVEQSPSPIGTLMSRRNDHDLGTDRETAKSKIARRS